MKGYVMVGVYDKYGRDEKTHIGFLFEYVKDEYYSKNIGVDR
jgi:hypothetical protein